MKTKTENKKDSKGRNLKQNEDQLKDGRYRFRYTDKYGERKAIYSWRLVTTDKLPTGKRQDSSLREKEKLIEKDVEDGIIQNSEVKSLSVSNMIQKYIMIKPKLANATKNNYLHILDKNIKPTNFGKMNASSARKSDVKLFYKYLYEEKNFAVGTIQLYQNLIFPAFQMLIDDSIIRLNPCRGCMKDFTHGYVKKEKFPLTRDEQNALLKFSRDDTIYSRYYVMIAFMLSTGCRIGEVIGLTWDDIDFTKKLVSINHQVIYKKKDGKTVHYVELPKNRTSRDIPLQDDIIEILKSYKSDTYFVSKSTTCEIEGLKTFVFLNKENKVYTPNTIVRMFHGLRNAYNKDREEDEVELSDFTPHTLRHTFCTRMAENGMDVKVLQTIMGHKTIEITMRVYNHADFERTQKEVENLPSVLQA